MPDNTMVGLVYPRSGLASKFGLIPSNCVGVIDSDYRGELMVSITNLSQNVYVMKPENELRSWCLHQYYYLILKKQSN